MLRHLRQYLQQLYPLRYANDLGGKISVQVAATACATIRTMVDNRVGIVAHHATMTLVAGLGPDGLGLLPPLCAVGRRPLRGGAGGIRRTLQSQHQLDYLLAAHPLKIGATHPMRESAKTDPRKGVGNYPLETW